ncbi:MAG: SIS domain-containing protein [Acidimicrobiia bacterium]|nr:SIS domain-containing protein [Acidimicrobiia bacterium]
MTDLTTRGAIDCVGHPVEAARLLAAAFDEGRRLAVTAPARDDHAHHVVVEFLHPVIAGTVALPAVVVPSGQRGGDDDVVLAIGDLDGGADLVIATDGEADIMIAYHLLWELVQLELADRPEAGGDSTSFLYPFLDGSTDDAGEHLRASAVAKVDESRQLAVESLAANAEMLERAASAVLSVAAPAGESGSVPSGRGRVLTMGNGGSATDAARAVRLLRRLGVPAQSLAADYAVLSALANDLGAERVFARQVEAVGRVGDVLIGFSTSGTSANLLAAFDEAKSRGLVTIGFAGYDGTGFAAHAAVDHTIAVSSQSVHRIQEAQAVLLDAMVAAVAAEIAERTTS